MIQDTIGSTHISTNCHNFTRFPRWKIFAITTIGAEEKKKPGNKILSGASSKINE